jgi:hypothetical protein
MQWQAETRQLGNDNDINERSDNADTFFIYRDNEGSHTADSQPRRD